MNELFDSGEPAQVADSCSQGNAVACETFDELSLAVEKIEDTYREIFTDLYEEGAGGDIECAVELLNERMPPSKAAEYRAEGSLTPIGEPLILRSTFECSSLSTASFLTLYAPDQTRARDLDCVVGAFQVPFSDALASLIEAVQNDHGSLELNGAVGDTECPYTPQPAWVSASRDELYTVGEEIPAGTYSINRNLDNDSCYWARLRISDGEIIDNHFGLQTGSITVNEGEVLEVNRCGYLVGPVVEDTDRWPGVTPVDIRSS